MNVDFEITGRYVHEIQAVLRAAGINEGTEYDAVPFSPASRANGQHTFAFRTKQSAAEAAKTWDAHLKQNPRSV